MRHHIYRYIFILLTVTLVASSPVAQDTKPDATQERIRQLEEQVKLLKEQVEKLVGVSATASQPKVENQTAVAKTAVEAKPVAEKKQPGIEIGSVRFVPYGTIFFNAFHNTSGTNNTDVPLFATTSGGANMSASVRQTRLGFRIEGARFGNANVKAVAEADFFGGFPAVGIGENFGVVRIRLANVRLDWEKTSLTVGQDWMVFAPVNPTSLAAAAIPQMAAAGNPWARIPQIKAEHRFTNNFAVQAAVLAPQTGDSSTTAGFFMQPNSGAASRVPYLQGRVAYSNGKWFGTKKAGSIGVSGHYGRSKVFTGTTLNIENDIESNGIALDWNFPLANRVSFAGEAFAGRNLGGFQSGVFQSYNNDFAYRVGTNLIAGGVRSIATRGGWAQLGITPKVSRDRLSLYASIGIDDPRDADLVTRTPRDLRRQNFVYAFDAIFKLTPQFQIGAEYRQMTTLYTLGGRRYAGHIDLGAAYTF